MESDTPRTDALVDEGGMPYDADFARKLERELAAERATTASLLRIIALIREAGGFTREDLAALPDAVKAMRRQRDEAHSLIRDWKVNLVDVVDDGEIMYAMTSDGRCSMDDAHKRAFLAATRKEGGGA